MLTVLSLDLYIKIENLNNNNVNYFKATIIICNPDYYFYHFNLYNDNCFLTTFYFPSFFFYRIIILLLLSINEILFKIKKIFCEINNLNTKKKKEYGVLFI